MRNPKAAKMHLMHAHKAVKDGDGVKARHHVGHAFAALKEGPLMQTAPETASATAMAPTPPALPTTAPKMSMLDRLRSMRGK